MKIGVFDSGVGGLSVANAVKSALPGYDVIFEYDTEHFPYGGKPADELLGYVLPILQKLVDSGCAVIVIACNTVSTTLIDTLREHITVPLIAIEPMVKPAAALTKSGIITVCATPTTLASRRYHWLKQTYAKGVQVLEPDCSKWSQLIEAKAMNEKYIADTIGPTLTAGADVIVLGCTHYHWIEEEIKQLAQGRAEVLQPEGAVIRQLMRLLA